MELHFFKSLAPFSSLLQDPAITCPWCVCNHLTSAQPSRACSVVGGVECTPTPSSGPGEQALARISWYQCVDSTTTTTRQGGLPRHIIVLRCSTGGGIPALWVPLKSQARESQAREWRADYYGSSSRSNSSRAESACVGKDRRSIFFLSSSGQPTTSMGAAAASHTAVAV